MARELFPISVFLGGLFLLSLLDLTPSKSLDTLTKDGVCPEIQERYNCKEQCGFDADCPDVHKCCPGPCSKICAIPNGKKGKCPPLGQTITNLAVCNKGCNNDTDCIGSLKCCINGCGFEYCLEPIYEV
ncbi:WAP four-disulfide core domain protein 2 isoform X2 [Antechinus flavipes]|uniref:WAP four-disulfide core domain protein 2 isoform X2 n=1 Tax=Antechinus flavipes TaxID=38775 RepID=UPI0022359184|nr:WAP four-disulfide core domain protein 2 isoform X2 [Antechinus flavipes]